MSEKEMNKIKIKGLLEAEVKRASTMLALIDKADDDIIRVFEQGFELAENNAKMGKQLCKETLA